MKFYIKIAIVVLAVAAIVFLCFKLAPKPVRVMTDKSDYMSGESLEVAIKNDFGKIICFSSCYPYVAEKEDNSKGWIPYSYSECEHDLATVCVAPGKEKKFRLALDDFEAGINRLKIPVCVDCQGQVFRSEFTFYSNNFEVK